MPVDYDPKDAVMCWSEDDYDAVLKKVEDKTSKVKPDGSGGNPMQVWTWEVYNADGKTQLISDYVSIPAAVWKIKQLSRALGKEADFKAGKFQADQHVGCSVIAELVIEEQSGYDEKNKIGKIKAKAMPTAPAGGLREQVAARRPTSSPISNEVEFKDEDIPFAWEGRSRDSV